MQQKPGSVAAINAGLADALVESNKIPAVQAVTAATTSSTVAPPPLAEQLPEGLNTTGSPKASTVPRGKRAGKNRRQTAIAESAAMLQDEETKSSRHSRQPEQAQQAAVQTVANNSSDRAAASSSTSKLMHKKSKDHKGVSTQQSKPASSIKNRVMVDAKGKHSSLRPARLCPFDERSLDDC